MPTTVRTPAQSILKAWLLAGALDILAAFIYYYIKTGKDPLTVLVFISKIVLGNTGIAKSITDNEMPMKAGGLIFHFCIALIWTLFFFWLLPAIKLLRINKILSGLVYGIFIWVMMNCVAMPIYRGIGYKFTTVEQLIVGMVVLMLAVGLPISVILNNNLSKRNAVAANNI